VRKKRGKTREQKRQSAKEYSKRVQQKSTATKSTSVEVQSRDGNLERVYDWPDEYHFEEAIEAILTVVKKTGVKINCQDMHRADRRNVITEETR
jgi:hypothetical protein